MSHLDSSHPLARLLHRDRRFKLDAYLFVLESLAYGQENLGMGAEAAAEDVETPKDAAADEGRRPRGRSKGRRRSGERHLSGQELCEAARKYALQQYGYMAPTVLGAWGVHRTGDFGEIVFSMIEIGQMRKTRHDKREDFDDVYDFAEAFTRDLAFVVPDAV
ncbi:MAG: Minf_1886 family protein [Planctomycetia bacterium]